MDYPFSRLHSPFFTDTLDALKELVLVAERRDWCIMFKPHPNLAPRLPAVRSDNLVIIRETSGVECVKMADVTVTLASAISYLSLAHQKPTVLLGRNTLSGADAAYELESREGLDGVLQDALGHVDFQERLIRFNRHVSALLNTCLYPYGDKSDFSALSYEDAASFIINHCNGVSKKGEI